MAALGRFEVVAQQTLVGLAVGAATAASYSVAVHLLALWLPVSLAGLVLLLWHNVSLRGLASLPEGRDGADESTLIQDNVSMTAMFWIPAFAGMTVKGPWRARGPYRMIRPCE